MSDYVHPLRFVNTPTVKEIWEAENGKEVESESTDAEVQATSDEYDRVSGNEGFYQLFLKHSPKPMSSRDLYSGTESFWDEIKKGVNYVIDSVKKFFKWVYSFFTSKKELVERTKNKLSKVIDVKGVKEGDIAYPALTAAIWNANGKPGSSLSWMSAKITEVDKAISKAMEYKDATKVFVEEVGKAMAKHGQLHKSKADVDNLVANFSKKVATFFPEGPFLGLTTVTINKDGKIILKRNGAISQKAVQGKYRTDVSSAKTILKSIEHANEEFGVLTTENMKLETVLIKGLEQSLRTGTNFDNNDKPGAKAVSEKVKSITNVYMANVKTLENVIHKSINAALGVVKSAIPNDSGNKE